MEGYYVEKTWFVFELHSRNAICKRNVCEEGDVQNKTRAVSDPPKTKSKKRKIQGISLLWMQIIFAAEILVICLAKT